MPEPTDPTATSTGGDDRATATDRDPATDRDDAAGGSRSRSRRRGGRGRGGRGRDDAAGTSDGATSAAAADRDDDRRSDTSGGDDDRPARRRRRGRRGRGRGKGGAAGDAVTDAPSADADDAEDVDAPKGEDASKRERAPRGGDAPGASAETREGGDASDGGDEPDGAPTSGRGGARDGRNRSAKGGSGKAGGTKGGDAKRSEGDTKRREDGGRRDSEGKDGDDPDADPADREVAAAMAKGGTRMAAKRGRRGGGGNGGGNGRGRGHQRPGGVPEEVRRAILEGPPRTMLVTNRTDRTQIAVLEDRTVCEHYVTRKKDVTFVGNIYMARVQNVLPGMEAAFLDIGKGRNGVLYAGEVLYDELDLEEGADQRIENVLKPGQKVLVQVTKDPMGSKGPRLTMHLSLAGRYVVLAPNSDLFGISRKLTDKERDRLRRIVKKVKPDEHGVIVRTAAENATEEQLTADVERLLAKWAKVEQAAEGAKALTTVYEEPPLVVKVIRDNFGPEFERCIVDDEDLYSQVRGYLDEVAPELSEKVELYGQPTADARARAAGAPSVTEAAEDSATTDGEEVAREAAGDDATDPTPVPAEVDLAAAATRRETLPPLFDAYDVTDQLRKATGKKVWLPSGGYLIIEQTEAMKVIDVNTGKFTGGKDTNLEEVVLKTNLEAADEIVRQLRLRDIGGIIIIDFIDMLLKANQDQVVRRLKRELLRDRTKTRVSEVSRLGLVQMTRKNVSQGLLEAFSHTCEACEGRGVISELE